MAEQNQSQNQKTQKIQSTKHAPPPPELPIYGRTEPKNVSFIGRTNYVAALEEKRFVFGFKREDRRHHLYVIGKSGVGKSKLLELLTRQDVAHGHGLCIMDPHGDLIDEILPFIPENRVDDVCLIDPGDLQHPVAFNPLWDVAPEYRHQLTQGLIEVLQKQFGANWTPHIEHIFRHTTLALLNYPQATMRDMIKMLTDESFRTKVTEHIKDEMIRRFWTTDFKDWTEKFDTDAIIPLVNKLGQFLSDPMLRNIFGQKENKIHLDKLIKQKKIILINLAKGKIGEENSSFLGSMFIIKIKQAGMARSSIPERDRHDFYFYIDEFQSIVTGTFENLLSEARKYGIVLTLAHQFTQQLPDRVLAGVLGNVGSIVVFRVGGEDAYRLKPEMVPVFDQKDMINLGMREFYIKMTIDGETHDPFSARTLRIIKPPHRSFKKEIVEASREKYTTSLQEINEKQQNSAQK